MIIKAILGNESHTTSSAYGKLSIKGKQVSYREAKSVEWLTKFGDKHQSWVECLFEVEEGTMLVWEAGSNTGPRGINRRHQMLTLRVEAEAELWKSEDFGYPCRLTGRLVVVEDHLKQKTATHDALKAQL